jgi:cytidylate kinase
MGDESGNEQDFDLKYEKYQQSLDPHAPVILDSRLGFYNQPGAFNVFLDVSSEESARRIFLNERETDKYDSLEEVLEMTEVRETKNKERYQKLYDVNLYDISQYDLVIDTTVMSPEEVAKNIMYAYDTRKTAQRGT